VPDNTPAAKADIQTGDRIVRIDSVQNPTWQQVEDVLLKQSIGKNQAIDVAVQRGNQVLQKQVTPESANGEADGYRGVGWIEEDPVSVTRIEPNMPAAQAGLRVGDQIVAVNGTPVRSLPPVQYLLQKNGDKPVEITALRDGQEMHFTATPVKTEDGGGKSRYRLGFESNHSQAGRLPFAQALDRSIQTNKKYSALIFELLHKMVRREASIKQMEGPIGIARVAGEMVQLPGWTPIILLTAGISLNLGIFNLLPIPILDGGMIVMLLIESIIRRDISTRMKERIYQTAFVFLVLFAVVVIYNDITKLPGLTHLP
jgi:regulator of sigma E protease